MQLTKNFNINEFACGDGTKVPENLLKNVKTLAENLQILRDYIGEPIHINSAYRHKAYNEAQGGKSNSQHLYAKAADITAKNKTPYELHEIIETLIRDKKMKQGGLGLYKGFVHYDVRGVKARW